MEFGLLGAFFILAAWLYETMKTYKKGEKLDKKFIFFYIIGLALLAVYSYQINSIPFLALNLILLFLTLIELELVMRQRKKKRRFT